MFLSVLTTCLGCALATLPSDTPPALRVAPPPISELRTTREIIAASRLVNGATPTNTIVLPTLINRDSLVEFINEHYPESSAAEPDMPYAWVYVSETGEAHVAGIIKSTRDAALDSLALATVRQARFKPALIGTVPVALWVPVPVQLSRPVPRGEKFVAYTKKPSLLNREEVSRRMVQQYPSGLQAAGIGGVVLLWVLIDEKGGVERTEVKESAGHPEFDDAAKFVALGMRFTPAKNHDKPVRVWVQIPVVFKMQ